MRTCFIFGSNLRGAHGKGAALHALQHHGAQPRVSEGFQGRGNPSYALPTVDYDFHPLPLEDIRSGIERLLEAAANLPMHPVEGLFLTRVGCGLAGHRDPDVAALFAASLHFPCARARILWPPEWAPYLPADVSFHTSPCCPAGPLPVPVTRDLLGRAGSRVGPGSPGREASP